MPHVFRAAGPIARVLSVGLIAATALMAEAAAQDAPPRRGIGSRPPADAAPPAAPPADRAPLDPAWVGGWIGTATVKATAPGAAAPELALALVVRNESGTPKIEVSSLQIGAVKKGAIEIAADGRSLAFTLAAQGQAARFAGALADDGKSATGTLVFVRDQRGAEQPEISFSIRRVDIVAELPESRVFAGTLDAGGQKLPMRLALGEGPHGWCGALDILVQGVRDFPVAVERTERGVTARFPAGVVATIELACKDGERTLGQMTVLEGTFRQGTFAAPIRFELLPGERAGAIRRPQQPTPPFPYESREVKVTHPLGHVLAGTLTVPASSPLAVDGRVPGIVCVTGSGPQDRDESLMGHKPFAVIADALTRAGIAVLRYDDRGTAASTGDYAAATTADFASDADMAVEWLKRQPGIDPKRIGLLGHSEGGLIGPIVAAWQNAGDEPKDPLAFLVLIAPPGETGGHVLTRQTRALAEAGGIAAEKLAEMISAHEAVMEEVRMRRAPDALRPSIAALLREQLKLAGQPIPDDTSLRMLVDQTLMQLTGPWMSEFIRLDPRDALSWLEVPTLAVWGTKDLQVDAAANGAIFAEVAKSTGAPIATRTFDGLNHLLQPARKGTVEEYGEIETTIDPSALGAIVAWVVETARTPAVRQVPEASRPESVRSAYVVPRLFYYREPTESAPASPVKERTVP